MLGFGATSIRGLTVFGIFHDMMHAFSWTRHKFVLHCMRHWSIRHKYVCRCGSLKPFNCIGLRLRTRKCREKSCKIDEGVRNDISLACGRNNYIYQLFLKPTAFNSLRPRPNRRYFADDIFKRIFLNENVWISIKISLKFVPKGPINNIPALVQIMAWRRSGDKPLSEPMMASSPTHICVTRPQWV